MSMNISGLGNTYNGINTNSKQYKALKEKGWLSGIMQNEAMMSPEERMIYETFGGRDTIIKNLMKQFDSDGDLLNANGVAGMDVTGKGTSWQQLTSVSEEYRQKMFDNVKREFIKENGISNGDTTKRSDIFKDYQLNHAHFCLPRCLCIRGIHCPSIVGISCYHLPILIIKFYVLTIARWQFLILYFPLKQSCDKIYRL